jgi:hypothetical protein
LAAGTAARGTAIDCAAGAAGNPANALPSPGAAEPTAEFDALSAADPLAESYAFGARGDPADNRPIIGGT